MNKRQANRYSLCMNTSRNQIDVSHVILPIMRKPAFLIALSLLLLSVVAYAQVKSTKKDTPPSPTAFEPKGFLVNDTDAYMPLPPEFLAAPKVTAVYPSPDGNYAVILQEDPPVLDPITKQPIKSSQRDAIPQRMLLWNKKTKQVRVVWRSIETPEKINNINTYASNEPLWLPKTSQFLFVVQTRPNIFLSASELQKMPDDEQIKHLDYMVNNTVLNLFKLDTIRGVVSGLREIPPTNILKSADTPVLAYKDVPSDYKMLNGEYPKAKIPNRFWLVTERGFSISPVDLPDSTAEYIYRWSGLAADGNAFVGTQQTINALKPSEKPLVKYLEYEIKTGKISEIDRKNFVERQKSQEKPRTLPYQLISQNSELRKGLVSTQINPLWIGGQQPTLKGKALIAADAASMNSPSEYLFYTINDTLYATQIAQMKRADLDEEMRKRKLSNAKQIGLAMMMYCQDYDESFPHIGSDVKDVIQPYLKNDSVFLDPLTGASIFSASYTEPRLAAINDPSITILGRLGGIVIYADGHVKWE
jgi:hypothetical protein